MPAAFIFIFYFTNVSHITAILHYASLTSYIHFSVFYKVVNLEQKNRQ